MSEKEIVTVTAEEVGNLNEVMAEEETSSIVETVCEPTDSGYSAPEETVVEANESGSEDMSIQSEEVSEKLTFDPEEVDTLEVGAETAMDIVGADPVQAVPELSVGNANIKCTITTPDGELIVGGSTEAGDGFVMFKCEEPAINPAIVISGGCKAIVKLFIDVQEDGSYHIICGCNDSGGCINLIRLDKQFSVLKAARVSDHETPITSLTKWNDEFVVGAVVHNADANEIVPIIIRVNSELQGINAIILNLEKPADFVVAVAQETTEGKEVVATGVVNQLVGVGPNLICGGTVHNTSGQSYGFVSIIDSELQPVKSCTLKGDTFEWTAINALTCECDTICIMGTCKQIDVEQIVGFKKYFDMDLNQIDVPVWANGVDETVH